LTDQQSTVYDFNIREALAYAEEEGRVVNADMTQCNLGERNMQDELDVNKITAEFLKQNLDDFCDTARGVLKTAKTKVRLRLDRTYKSYLTCLLKKHSKAKTFFIRAEPTPLQKFYVPLSLTCGDKTIRDANVQDIASRAHFSIITGSAGVGKSLLMRHLLMSSLLSGGKVPVFIELRDFNQNDCELISAIENTLRLNKFNLDATYIEEALKAGHFALFLDGFDEVVAAKRQALSKSIQGFARRYDSNYVLVSSRPDNEFAGWPDFSVFSVSPLSLKKATELVNKLTYDAELKAKFVSDLQGGLFRQHKSFLSNPLLLSIMLLTYGESAAIPTKLTVFFNQAYEALFQRHDALKAGFQRQRRTKLDIQDFAKVFSAFCLQSYDKRKFAFTQMEAMRYLEKAKSIVHLEYDKSDYLRDALQAVCLLVEEGLDIVFAHRSFQEYFSARFIAEAPVEIQQKLVLRYCHQRQQDHTMYLLYELRPDLLEKHYIVPGIRKLLETMKVKKKIGITHFTRYLKHTFHSIQTDEQGELTVIQYGDSRIVDLLSFSLQACGSLVNWSWPRRNMRGFMSRVRNAYIIMQHLTYRDAIVKELAANPVWWCFSVDALKAVQRIGQALAEKHRMTTESIEEVLGT